MAASIALMIGAAQIGGRPVGATPPAGPSSGHGRHCVAELGASTMRCFAALNAAVAAATGQFGSAEQVQSALAECTALWRQGFLVPGSTIRHPPQGEPSAGTRPVPTLVACTLPGGTAAIFPTEGPFTCGRLGLASPRSQSHTP